ncbi:hypothetical protein [Dyella humicola]|uniref:hypothetical protein n=1 Tax=Dyella humicola TaxID=2992126 RepID=UPI00224CA5C4|nr:hypothetical protein [Dyella humicola]
MKLLRDFFRLRTAGRQLLAGRRAESRRSWTITVPAPLHDAAAPAVIDMHWKADASRGRPVARWHEHVPPQAQRHLQLVSSH